MSTGHNYDAYVEEVYKILKRDTVGLDAIYEDYIIHLVGTTGLIALQVNKYLETCGAVNGRPLYVLCCEEES